MTDCTSVIKHDSSSFCFFFVVSFHSIREWNVRLFTKRWHSPPPLSHTADKVGFPLFLQSAKFIWLPWQASRVIVARLVFFTTALLFCCENSRHGVAHPPLASHCCHSRSAESSLLFQLALSVRERGQEHQAQQRGHPAKEPARRAGGRRRESWSK